VIAMTLSEHHSEILEAIAGKMS